MEKYSVSEIDEEFRARFADFFLDTAKSRYSFELMSRYDANPIIRRKRDTDSLIMDHYLEKFDIERNLILYVTRHLDIKPSFKIFSGFERKILFNLDKSLDEDDFRSELKKITKNDIYLCGYDVDHGFPRTFNHFDDEGTKPVRTDVREGITEKSIDFLVINTGLLTTTRRLSDDIYFCLSEDGILAINYSDFDYYCRFNGLDIERNDPYVLPGMILRDKGIRGFVPIDLELDISSRNLILKRTGREISYLNQLSDWYYFRKNIDPSRKYL